MRSLRTVRRVSLHTVHRWSRWAATGAVAFPTCVATSAAAQEAERAAPIAVEAVYTADIWQNVNGGIRRDFAYLDNLDFAATVDGEQLLGLPATTIVASLLYNNRRTLSDRIVGDLQTVSNIDTDGALRWYEAWVEHNAGPVAAKVGLIDLNSEFDVNDTGALFLNSSHGIGPEFSQIGENGPGIFPITALGGRLAFDVDERARLSFGVFEGVAGDPDRPRRTLLRLDRGEGALVVGEAEVRPREGFRLAAGLWHQNVRGADPGTLRRTRTTGGYAIVEGRLGTIAEQPLNGFARMGAADTGVHRVSSYQGAGLALGRAPDETGGRGQLGLAVASAVTSRSFRAERASLGLGAERRETTIELTYRLQPLPWIALQPDIQYVINPGADPALRNALVAGMRVEIGWSWTN